MLEPNLPKKKPFSPLNNADDGLGLAAFRRSAADEGLSLEQLSETFASMIARGHDPYAEPQTNATAEFAQASRSAPAVRAAEIDRAAPTSANEGPRDPCPLSPRSILEAMLFVGHPAGEPLTSQQVADLMRGIRAPEIDDLVRELNEQYARLGCPYTIAGEGAGYRLVLREEFHRVRDKLHGRTRQARLSPAAIEVLAVVAYNEPLASDDIGRLRGKPSGHLLAQLVRRQLLRVERPPEKPRRPFYRTTQRFLELFGLASLEDLPRSEEIERR
jgi:segregation and condensation protein B